MKIRAGEYTIFVTRGPAPPEENFPSPVWWQDAVVIQGDEIVGVFRDQSKTPEELEESVSNLVVYYAAESGEGGECDCPNCTADREADRAGLN